MVYIFLADGFETIEALTVVDMLRRAGIGIQTVSMQADTTVTSAHKIAVQADVMLSDVTEQEAEMYVLPGGIPGTPNLRSSDTLMQMLEKQYKEGKYIAAICAAPGIFSELGFLKGRHAICYPSYEEQLEQEGAFLVREGAVVDGNVITGRGMGTAIDFAAAIITVLKDGDTADAIKKAIVYEV
ncbi:MAG: DJ-1/PfpI family protein [Lachnospiraceae bacterium]|nr:DJ-1/PfpI family protein [Lachnospiraceae bacterium]